MSTIGRKARLEADTARRYSDLFGGSEDPTGELWAHLAHVAELVAELAATEEPARIRVSIPADPDGDPDVILAPDFRLTIPEGGAPLTVAGNRVGTVHGLVGISDDRRSIEVEATVDDEGFLHAAGLGLIDGVSIAGSST